jgi:hypothetical protein
MIPDQVTRHQQSTIERLDLTYDYSNLTNIYRIVYFLFHIMLRRA